MHKEAFLTQIFINEFWDECLRVNPDIKSCRPAIASRFLLQAIGRMYEFSLLGCSGIQRWPYPGMIRCHRFRNPRRILPELSRIYYL